MRENPSTQGGFCPESIRYSLRKAEKLPCAFGSCEGLVLLKSDLGAGQTEVETVVNRPTSSWSFEELYLQHKSVPVLHHLGKSENMKLSFRIKVVPNWMVPGKREGNFLEEETIILGHKISTALSNTQGEPGRWR